MVSRDDTYNEITIVFLLFRKPSIALATGFLKSFPDRNNIRIIL